MIISNKAKEQKLILIFAHYDKVGPQLEGYCSHTSFKNTLAEVQKILATFSSPITRQIILY
jgi:hypothetical protein